MAKYKSRQTRLAEAIDQIQGGIDEVQDIYDELEEWRTGMEGTNLESTQKYEDLGEALDTLEEAKSNIENGIADLEGIEIPGAFGR